ncbi:hypothetical protein [Escherichia phage EP_H11]|nr:hypothetical protein [Escherichia phage EP_H11]
MEVVDSVNAVDLVEVSEAVQFDVVENASEVDGKYVLAKAVGPAFFPGQTSGNKVYYPEALWEKVLADGDVNSRLQNRTMFGTIGHDIEDINDEVIRRGELSHIVTKLFVDDAGVGRAEYLVVNTPTGQILNTLLRAGSKLRVSTKAKGALSHPDENGVKTLRSYYLKRIDFVLTPGFEQALPEVAESLNKIRNQLPDPVEESKMEQNEFIEHLKAENAQLKAQVDESKQANTVLKTQLEEAKTQLATATTQLAEVSESLAKYQTLGTFEQVDEALTKGAETITSLKESLNETIEESAHDIHDLEVVEEALEKYKELGTPEEISEAIATLNGLIEEKETQVCESLAKKFKRSPNMIKTMQTALGGLDKVEEALLAEAAELGIKIDESDDGEDKGDGKDDKGDDKSDKKDGGDDKGDDADESKKTPSKVEESLNRVNRLGSLMSTRQIRTNLINTQKVDESAGKTADAPQSRAGKLMSRR